MTDESPDVDEIKPTRYNEHICSICCRALPGDTHVVPHKTGELALTFDGKRYSAKRLCGACVEALRAAMSETIRRLQP